MTSRNCFFPIGRVLLEYGRGWMVCITIRFLFMVISSNQLYLVHFFSLTEIKQKFPFLRTALGPWRRLSVSIQWQLKPVIVSFGFHTFIMIFQKIVNDIQRFTKTEYFPISLSPSQFSNLSEISRQYFYDQIFCIKHWALRRPCNWWLNNAEGSYNRCNVRVLSVNTKQGWSLIAFVF